MWLTILTILLLCGLYLYRVFIQHVYELRHLDLIINEKSNHHKILDLGASNTILKNRYPLKNVTAMDIDGPGVQNGGVEIYDGHHIPYPDNYFDTTILSFVLHHVPHQLQLLDEVKRVTRNDIIVLEDVIDESPSVSLAKFLTGLHYRIFEQDPDTTIQFQHNNKEWSAIFKKKQLRMLNNIAVRPIALVYPVAHRLYHLKAK